MPHYQSFDGLNLYYEDQGAGLPVVCLPGLTRNTHDFDDVAPHLKDVRLIRLDYRGRGRSDYGDWHHYTVPVEGRDVLTLLDHLGIDRAAFIGTSRGGLITMMLAALAPDRVIGAALNDIGPELATNGIDRIMGYLGNRPPWKTIDDAVAALPHVMQGFNNVPESRWRAHAQRSYVETPDGLDIAYDKHLRDAVLEAAATPAPDLWPLFDALKGRPLALIRGANSDLLSPKAVEKMRARHPGMIYANVPDRAHVPYLDEPEALAALGEWLKQCRSA